MKVKLYNIFLILMVFGSFSLDAQICVGTPGQLEWELYDTRMFGYGEDNPFGELTSAPNYPNHPNVVQTLYKTQAPTNYDERYGARLRGFIHVDTTVIVTFNITGNYQVNFYLSTDSLEANKQLMAHVPNSTDYNGNTPLSYHSVYASQTTGNVTLTAGVNYYFELISIETTGSDHMTLWWKNPLVSAADWNVISAQYINGIGCLPAPCPEINTPCDDGDGGTTDDQEDGYCNCVGTPTNITNPDIGPRGVVKKYRYEGISGGGLGDLFAAANFPGMPDYSENLLVIGQASDNDEDDTGTLVQGYLTVPVTGNYKFNVTSDDNSIAFLSSNDDPVNKQAHQFLVTGNTDMNEHDRYIYQNTSFIQLNAGEFYYFELNHKNGGGNSHFNIFWQTPFNETGVWKQIPPIHFYGFEGDIACIPQGTPCDDGDPFTNNDVYDNACNCAGTPCLPPNCNDLVANYIPFEKCAITDQLGTNSSDNWLSCTATANPNTARPTSHWIKYDLDESYQIFDTRIWNYNAQNDEDLGFEMVAIDYSEDGINWTEFGTYNWNVSSGGGSYSGFNGPNLGGVQAKHILVTSLDGTSTCRGLGKVAFTAVSCPSAGTLCDDGNPITIEDKFDNQCNCIGVNLFTNPCETDILNLGDSILLTNNYNASQQLMSVSQIQTGNTVSFYGGNSIELLPGFETQPSTVFWAAIDTCDTSNSTESKTGTDNSDDKGNDSGDKDNSAKLEVTAIKNTDRFLIQFEVEQPGQIILNIVNSKGKVVSRILDYEFENAGLYHKIIRSKKLTEGIYTVALTTPISQENEPMVIE